MSQLVSVSDMFSQSWAAYKLRQKTFIVPMVVEIVLIVILSLGAYLAASAENAFTGILAILLCIAAGVAAIINGAAVYRVPFNEPSVKFEELFKQGARRVLPMIGTAILVELAVIAGFVIFIIPGIYLAIGLSFATLLAVRGSSPLQAFKQSRAMVHGKWWGILGRLILVSLLTSALNLPTNILFGIANNAEYTTGLILTIIAGVYMIAYMLIVGPWMIMLLKTLLDSAEKSSTSAHN